MRARNHIKTANDNAPLQGHARETQVKLHRRIAHARQPHAPANYAVPARVAIQNAASLPAFTQATPNQINNKNILGITALIICTLMATYAYTQNAAAFTTPIIIAGISGFALLVSFILRSKFALMASLYISALWASVCLLNLTNLEPYLSAHMALAIPLLSTGQLAAAAYLRTLRATIITTVTFAAWLFILTYNAGLSASAIGSAAFMAGAAQHRLGKTARDHDIRGAHWHILFGWAVAIAGLSYVQHIWLNPNVELFQSAASVTASPLWVWTIGLSALAILGSSFIRLSNKTISVPGLLAVSLATAIIPLSVYQAQWVSVVFGSLPGLKASPVFGLVIGGAILASAMGMVISGLLRNHLSYIIAGVIVFGIQIGLMLKPAFSSVELAFVTLLSLIVALAVGGGIAGRSLSAASNP